MQENKVRKLFLLALVLVGSSWGQLTYTVSKTTTLSSSAEVVTVQQPATGAMVVKFISAYIDSTAACTITIERSGTAATTTSLTPVGLSSNQAAATTTAYYSSDVGTGSVMTRASIPAGGSIVVDLTRFTMSGNGTSKNLTVRTGTCSGTVDIVITYTES